MAFKVTNRIILAIFLTVPLILQGHSARAVTLEEVTQAAELTARYLMKSQKLNGLFEYEFDFARSKYSSDDNVVRQAGAGAVLAEYYLATGDQRVEATLIAAIEGYAAKSIAFGEGKVLTLNKRFRGARLGGTALALLTELRYHEGIEIFTA